jgi:hypothetical protein
MKLPLRFNLKTLLIALALCAVACAGIWQFWPRYRAYRARMRFETAAAEFRPPMTMNEIESIVGHGTWETYSSDANGIPNALAPFFFEGAWYCVYMELDPSTGEHICRYMPSTAVKTFRLALPPAGYQPQTQSAKDEVNPPDTVRTTRMSPKGPVNFQAPAKQGDAARRAAYIEDFRQLVSQKINTDLGIHYEQLPPAHD